MKQIPVLNLKTAVALMVVLMLVGATLFASYSLSSYSVGILNPGFEGGKSGVAGVIFGDTSYKNSKKMLFYNNSDPILAYKGLSPATSNDKYFWTNAATPNDVTMGHLYPYTLAGQTARFPDIGVHVGDIQLKGVSITGDPLNYGNETATRIDYSNLYAYKTETGTEVTYHYNYTVQSALLVPAEFYVGFYLIPYAHDYGSASSGWREGTYSNIQVWFRLDWTTWNNAYRDAWLNDPQQNVFKSTYDGQIARQQKLFDYRGGFPISAWIQAWEKAGYSSLIGQNGAVTNPSADSAIWYQTRGRENKIYTQEQLQDLQDKLFSKCQFTPDKVGEFLSLYDVPSEQFSYDVRPSFTDFDDTSAVLNNVKSPDTRMRSTMYFPINVASFGTLADGDWYHGYRVFYPSAYFLVRVIYGVYGTFTYLWTEQVSKATNNGGLGFPEKIEKESTVVIHTLGAGSFWEFLTDWIADPTKIFLLIFFAIIVFGVIIVVLNPNLVTVLARTREERQKRKS